MKLECYDERGEFRGRVKLPRDVTLNELEDGLALHFNLYICEGCSLWLRENEIAFTEQDDGAGVITDWCDTCAKESGRI